MYMKDSIEYGDEGGGFVCVADEVTPQACYRSAIKQEVHDGLPHHSATEGIVSNTVNV